MNLDLSGGRGAINAVVKTHVENCHPDPDHQQAGWFADAAGAVSGQQAAGDDVERGQPAVDEFG